MSEDHGTQKSSLLSFLIYFLDWLPIDILTNYRSITHRYSDKRQHHTLAGRASTTSNIITKSTKPTTKQTKTTTKYKKQIFQMIFQNFHNNYCGFILRVMSRRILQPLVLIILLIINLGSRFLVQLFLEISDRNFRIIFYFLSIYIILYSVDHGRHPFKNCIETILYFNIIGSWYLFFWFELCCLHITFMLERHSMLAKPMKYCCM